MVLIKKFEKWTQFLAVITILLFVYRVHLLRKLIIVCNNLLFFIFCILLRDLQLTRY
jgi:hypothetical protein